jgi:hypothetical protein
MSMDRPDNHKQTFQSLGLGGLSTDTQSAHKHPVISPRGFDPLSSDDPMPIWLLSLQRDLLGPTYSVINHVDAMSISGRNSLDQAALHTVFSAARSLERNLCRLVDLAKLSSGTLRSAPEVGSVQSLTHEAVIVARAMAPHVLNGGVCVHPPAIDVVATLEKRIFVELLATITLLVYRASARAQCDLQLSFTGQGADTRTAWRISAERGALPARSLEALQSDALWASRHLFDLAFVERVVNALGGSVAIQNDRSGFVCELPTPPIHKGDSPNISGNILWTTAPILLSSASPQGFMPVPGKVFILNPNLDDFPIETQIQESGARLFIVNHFPTMSAHVVLKLLVTCVGLSVPVLFRSSALDYDTMCNFRDHVDAIVLEPCSRETLARYVVGLTTHNRRAIRRPAQIHT